MSGCGVGLYVHNSAQAVELYKEAFGLELGYHVLNPDGSYFHSELNKNGEEILSVVESPTPAAAENPVQLGMTFHEKEALLRAFALLGRGGKTLMDVCTLPWSPCAAEVVDRFGIRWYLSLPQHRPPDTFTPDSFT